MDACILSWTILRSRGENHSSPNLLAQEAKGLLQGIAFKNHSEKSREFANPTLDDDKQSDLWRDMCGDSPSGAVVPILKIISQGKLFQFSHLSFQKYFFTTTMIEKPTKEFEEEAVKMIDDPWFLNVIRIAAGAATRYSGSRQVIIEKGEVLKPAKMLDLLLSDKTGLDTLTIRHWTASDAFVTVLLSSLQKDLHTLELPAFKFKDIKTLEALVLVIKRNESVGE